MRAYCHVEKNLKALEKFPRVALDNIRDFPEAFKPVGLIKPLVHYVLGLTLLFIKMSVLSVWHVCV